MVAPVEKQDGMIAGFALVFDYMFGYPQWLYRRIGHPVTWIGAFISFADRSYNRESDTDEQRKTSGAVMLLGVVALAAGWGWVCLWLAHALPMSWVWELILVASLLAGRSLHTHVAAVRNILRDHGIEAARRELSKIVGRDTSQLDETDVCRAAIESLSENTSDGLVAPLFWYLLAGLPGIAIYKAVNTADSMVGYKSARHLHFGWASARMDDLLNLAPARLTALFYAVAAIFYGPARPLNALKVAWRDAQKHASPNAGWPEAAMAGALNIRLGGPGMRGGVPHPDPYFGKGRVALNVADISTALALYRRLCALVLILTLAAS